MQAADVPCLTPPPPKSPWMAFHWRGKGGWGAMGRMARVFLHRGRQCRHRRAGEAVSSNRAPALPPPSPASGGAAQAQGNRLRASFTRIVN